MYGSNRLLLWVEGGGILILLTVASVSLSVCGGRGQEEGEGQHRLQIFVIPPFPMKDLKLRLSPKTFPSLSSLL